MGWVSSAEEENNGPDEAGKSRCLWAGVAEKQLGVRMKNGGKEKWRGDSGGVDTLPLLELVLLTLTKN